MFGESVGFNRRWRGLGRIPNVDSSVMTLRGPHLRTGYTAQLEGA